MYLETIRLNGEKVLNSTQMRSQLDWAFNELEQYHGITERKRI